VVDALNSLIEREGDVLIVKLPRTPGRKDAEYMHLFCGEVDLQAHASNAEARISAEPTARTNVADLEQRISDLETEVEKLKQLLS
jgi:uncharacterized protein YceH (UPF0502 family)